MQDLFLVLQETIFRDSLSDAFHEPDQKTQVVDRHEAIAQSFVVSEKVIEVGFGVVAAAFAIAFGIKGCEIVLVDVLFDVDATLGSH